MFKRILMMSVGLLAALALLLSINVLVGSSLRSSRFDLTENKLYTLSDGAKAVLAKIEEPITLRFYYSKQLAQEYPPLPSYGRRVEELLLEFENHAGGKLELEVIDPEPFTEAEDRAVQLGLRGVPLPSGETLYFGLAGTNTIGDEDVVPFFSIEKESFLEYDLTKLVHGLSNPERGVVGLLSSLPIEGEAANPMMMQQQGLPQPWFVMDQIRQLHEVQTLMPGVDEIPDEVGLLMVVHPKQLPPATLYAIDQFVLGGGKALVFVDPFCEQDIPPQDPQNPMAAMMAPRNSDLGPLLAAWGLAMPADQLAGDLPNALSVTFNNRGRDEPVDYLIWLGLDRDAFTADEIVTGDINHMKLASAGVLSPAPDATTEFIPLIRTSEESMQVAVTQVQFGPNPPGMLADFFPGGQRLALAARISGPAQSAFPDGPPAAEGEEPATTGEHQAESAGDINVIVVADADLLADRWWVRVQDFGGMRVGMRSADNGVFVNNAIDYLLGSTDLISLRGRGDSDHPFEVVRELEQTAQLAYRAEEQRLVEELDRTETELNNMLSQGDGQSALLQTPESLAAIERLRAQQLTTRSRLREVRANLRRDIERLGIRLKWLNIGAIPALVLLFALAMTVIRVNRRRPAQ